MPEFLKLLPPAEALEKLLKNVSPIDIVETIETNQAVGRAAAEKVLASQDLPSFARTTVDGYTVRAKDTHGASDNLPMYLTHVGEVSMGGAPEFEIGLAQCALIHTGGMLPKGADAVVMVEDTQQVRTGEIEILRAVSVGENVIQIGEDVVQGQTILSKGRVIRPADIGGLMATGFTKVKVAKRPDVAIISSGDEVVPPETQIKPGQVRDINSYTLSALVEQAGGVPHRYGIVSDTFEALQEVAKTALQQNDMLVITAGSSASTRDMTAQVIDTLGNPGVLVHGVNVRPGKPTILGSCGGKVAVGLPGNPVSALIIAGLFVTPVIERLLGIERKGFQAKLQAKLAVNLSSKAGREDWVPVKLKPIDEGFMADPIFGKSNLIFTLAKADGLIKIPADANGMAAGEKIMVWLV